jgi:hypothetical protein
VWNGVGKTGAVEVVRAVTFGAGEASAGSRSRINSRQTQSGGREDEWRRSRLAGHRLLD